MTNDFSMRLDTQAVYFDEINKEEKKIIEEMDSIEINLDDDSLDRLQVCIDKLAVLQEKRRTYKL